MTYSKIVEREKLRSHKIVNFFLALAILAGALIGVILFLKVFGVALDYQLSEYQNRYIITVY